MSATSFQSSLDAFLEKNGVMATLMRTAVNGSVVQAAQVPMFERALRADEMIPGSEISQDFSVAIISATHLLAQGWLDSPRDGDRLVVSGKMRRVFSAPSRALATGWNLRVKG